MRAELKFGSTSASTLTVGHSSLNDKLEVHKFGGTSVSALDVLLDLVTAMDVPHRVIVCSAFSGVTDHLLACISASLTGTAEEQRASVVKLREIHTRALDGIEARGWNVAAARKTVFELLEECEGLLRGVALLRECSARSRDNIIAFGELLSCPVVACALRAEFIDSRKLIRTDELYGNATVDFKTSAMLCEAVGVASKPLVVCPGFIATSSIGTTTTLGRSGSDYTATILGAILKARRVVIWTDVYGVYSADPRMVKDTYTLESISYREAAEMAFFGSKVLFSKMIHPCEVLSIPIEVRKTTLEKKAPLTLISRESTLVAAVSCIRSVSLIIVSGPGMKGRVGMASSVFDALKECNASAIMIAQASSEQELCFVVETTHAAAVIESLNRHFQNEMLLNIINAVERRDRFSVVNIILGNSMQNHPGVAAKLFSAAGAVNVNIVAIAQPGSEISVSCVVAEDEASRCMQAFHRAFSRDYRRISVLLVGASGAVGSAVLSMIQRQAEMWRKQMDTDVRVVCTANSKDIHFLDSDEHTPSSFTSLVQQLRKRRYENLHTIDCTASPDIAQHYPAFLELGVLIVANKRGSAGPLDLFDKLNPHRLTRRYRYEATVMAGLPVLSTLQSLIASGDRIRSVSGVFSGTLSFIFNSMAGGKSFKESVLEAKRLGYTEPDPRDDLSGADFLRKLIILGREIGVRCTQEQVEWTSDPLVPASVSALSLDAFLSEGLNQLDAPMGTLAASASAKGERLVFVGSVNQNTGRVAMGVQSVSKTGPYGSLSGANNIVVIESDYYPTQPLVVSGPGAGSVVTASGVVSDLMK